MSFLGSIYTFSLDAQIRRDLEQWQATHTENPGLSTKLPGEKEPNSAEKQKKKKTIQKPARIAEDDLIVA